MTNMTGATNMTDMADNTSHTEHMQPNLYTEPDLDSSSGSQPATEFEPAVLATSSPKGSSPDGQVTDQDTDHTTDISETSDTSNDSDTPDTAAAGFDDSEDSLTFSNGVIEKIVALSIRTVPGIIGMKGSWFNRVQDVLGATDTRKGVSVDVDENNAVQIHISVIIEYGAYAPQVFEDAKTAVVKEIAAMTGLEVSGVHLRIDDVMTQEEYSQTHGDLSSLLEK